MKFVQLVIPFVRYERESRDMPVLMNGCECVFLLIVAYLKNYVRG